MKPKWWDLSENCYNSKSISLKILKQKSSGNISNLQEKNQHEVSGQLLKIYASSHCYALLFKWLDYIS